METKLNIFGIKILIESNEEIAQWLKNDYGTYITQNLDQINLKFYLINQASDYSTLPKLKAKTYHDNYIIYDSNDIRFIDFLGKALTIYNSKTKEIKSYCQDINKLYQIFELSFESLLGEELDKIGFNRIHCLSLEKNNQATLILLPPGGGKTTLALKFLNHSDIKILSQDIALYKKNKLYGLNFYWGVRVGESSLQGRLVINSNGVKKLLVNPKNFNLAKTALPKNLILGQKVSSNDSKIKKVNKLKLFWPLFKSTVLGLELQQSLAYFLLRNYKDGFSKIKIGFSRLKTIISLIKKSSTYCFEMGRDIQKNYKTLDNFINQSGL